MASFTQPVYWQIRYLIAGLSKKNYKSSVSELHSLTNATGSRFGLVRRGAPTSRKEADPAGVARGHGRTARHPESRQEVGAEGPRPRR